MPVHRPVVIQVQAEPASPQQDAAAHVPGSVRYCQRCRAAGQRTGGLLAPAVVRVDVSGGWAGFPMDVCGQHYEAGRAFFGAGLVRVVERYES